MEPAATETAAALGVAGAALAERAAEAQEGASTSAVAAGPRRGRCLGEREEVPLRVRLGRARRRAGPCTPSPSWKLEGEEVEVGELAPVHPAVVAPARRSTASVSASARQLGASLWEIHDVMREGRRGGVARRRRSGRALAGWGLDGAGVELHQKNKHKEKIAADIHSLQDELEDERRLRRHSEDLHRKFGKELSEIKSAFVKAVKDLEKEKKTNSLLEDLCDQFAMGIRDYEDEVRALKQRHLSRTVEFKNS
ncbi:hypothetical protein E2562_013127 [Oryza meyeriana var. granulata]|uniref:Uncharacterized protein n=1 Tax=Oryza meyeriana var. granulata TaxID=110450 RepID=A0A6G1F7L7_9ORYZ|nr:hypothetical protein E2562_013127 [Oryza meyeriana var. granulata]